MLNRRQALTVVVAAGIGAVSAPAVRAEEDVYELTTVFDGERPTSRALVVLNGRAFKTLSSQALRDYVARLKPGTIRYDRGCLGGGELDTILPTDAEVACFAAFCQASKVMFVLPPAG